MQATPQPTPTTTASSPRTHPLAGLDARIRRANKAGVITVQIVHDAGGKILGWRMVDEGELHGYGKQE